LKINFRLAPVLLMIFFLFSCGRQAAKVKNITVYENKGSGEEIVLENEFLEFRFLPGSAEFILKDKASGAEWRSNPRGAASDSMADAVTMQMMMSQFSLLYSDVAGVGITLYSSEHSVERGAFEYALADGGLEVRYTVGNLSRSYLFPAAVPEERMLTFFNKMDREDRRKVEASYRLYDINNLRDNDDRNSLLALYPDLNHVKVYVLRDNTQEYMMELIEEYFAGAGYTYEDFLDDAARYVVTSGKEKPAFNVTLRYALEGRSLAVTVPFDGIAYRPAFPLTQLNLLPFMGAGGLDDEGYILVPDGSGALIYFNNGRQNQIAYNNNVYGWDEAMPRDAVVSDNRAPYPVFGIQKNGAALLCVIEEGSSYASVRADVSGRNCSWNSVYPRFEMIHGAKMDISGRSDRAVFRYEGGLSEGESITLRYSPCASDGYVGMAKEYRSRLLEKYPVLKEGPLLKDMPVPAEASLSGQDGGVPVAVEIIGAVNKTRHRLGIPFDLPLRLTSYSEAAAMINDFADFGWKNVRVKINGWFNRSVDHSVPTKIKLIGELGGRRDFHALVSAASRHGYALYPEVDFFHIKDVKAFGGFSLYRDAARYINRKRIEKYPFSFVWFGERTEWGKLSYIARPESMMAMIDGFVRKEAAFGLENIAFRNMGSRLAGDYNDKKPVSREAAMNMRKEKLEKLAESGTGVLINTGYVYAVPWASIITDIALNDQGFGITDASVPFYQIVLHGLVPYTGRAINLAEDYTKNLLETVECGAGLYFSFMTEETAVLQETKFRQFYANEYGKWAGDADALYKKFTADFSGLYSQAIADHKILSPEVTLTEYEDGTRVIVNASGSAWKYRDGVTVKSNGYVVLRQGL